MSVQTDLNHQGLLPLHGDRRAASFALALQTHSNQMRLLRRSSWVVNERTMR